MNRETRRDNISTVSRSRRGLLLAALTLPLCIFSGATQTGSTQPLLSLQGGTPPPGPTIIGPGLAPNIGTPINPSAGAYYRGYGEPDYNGAISGLYSNNAYGYVFDSHDIPQTTTRTRIQLNVKSQIAVTWEGPTHSVASIRVALLDKAGKLITQKVISKAPTRAVLTRNSKVSSITVTTNYINGMSSTVTSDIQ